MISAKPTVYTVTQLNDYVKTCLDSNPNLSTLFITGEISNCVPYASGHIYMTLKDENAAIKAVMFSTYASRLKFKLENGMKIIAIGSVSLYSKTGSYQINIRDIQPDGVGALNMAFEQLKKKLASEGLFDESRKKTLPKFPENIGVVTSGSGAAVRDIINVLGRRYPVANVIVRPTLVQGDGAASDIAKAIRLFNDNSNVDFLIVGRGGGSIEDLWAFNEEIVARAVASSDIPIISAVGHETNFTICDFVADLSAPTPSAAAELAVPDMRELLDSLDFYADRLMSLAVAKISAENSKIGVLSKSLEALNPAKTLENDRKMLGFLSEKLKNSAVFRLEKEKSSFAEDCARLNALSPLNVISRGYAVVYDGEKLVSSVSQVKVGDSLSVKVSDGVIKTKISEINGENDG